MSAPSISSENLPNAIDLFADDIKSSFSKFEELEDMLIILKSDFKNQQSIKNNLKDIKCEFFYECEKLNKLELKEKNNVRNNKSEISVLEKSRDEIKNLFTEGDNLDSNIKSKLKNCIIDKDDEVADSQENINKSPNKINLFILQSRQTEEPFVITTMKGGTRYKCNGCNQNIPIQSRFLSHIEEFPSGSKTFIPHSYHISSVCLLQRGFEISYLEKAKISSSETINKELIDILHEIGFKKKNMKIKDSIDSDNDSENSDNIPDNVSDISNISGNPAIGASNAHSATFTYRRKPQDQRRNIICHGCKLNIDAETYLTYDDNIQSFPVHIKKGCIKEGRIFHNDFSKTICKVYKLLKTHDELKELIACGFYFNKIIGYRPSNPNVKRPFSKSFQKLGKPRENQGDKPTNSLFIFNEEPFMLERLPHGERCRGCNNQIKKDELSLRHKERVPREKMDQSPLISQYYHADRNCLFDRGFNSKYLSFIKCYAILAGDDNLAKFTEVLTNCGFSNENIIYQTKNSQEVKGFEIASPSNIPDKEYKLFIINCINSSSHCEGCGFIVIPDQPCFIYSLTASQSGNAKIFHIRNSCLKAHFTKEQLLAMTCVNNNVVDVSPNEIINCGIVKIVTDSQFSAPVAKRQNVKNFRPKLRNQKPLSFIVDIVVDDRYTCVACKDRLVLDKYVIKMYDKDPERSHVHLDHKCVKKLGYSPSELARSRLKLNVFLSPEGITRLRYCGFHDVPSK